MSVGEVELRAAIVAESADATTAEAERAAGGALAAAYGCAGGRMPLQMLGSFRPLHEPRQPEQRAITPGVESITTPQPVTPYAFDRSALGALGFLFPVVPPGVAAYPVVTTAPPADAVDKDAAAPNTAAAFTLTERKPKRVSGSFDLRVEDIAIMPQLEAAMQDAILSAVENEIDEEGFNGDGTGGNLNGLFQQAANVAIAGAVVQYATGVELFSELVDGQHAYSLAEIRACIGPATFAKFSGTYRNGSDGSLQEKLEMQLGSIRTSKRMPAKAANGQKGIVTLTAAMGDPLVPMWGGMELISDPYSGAGEGKRTVTAICLVGDPFLPHGQKMLKEVHPKLS